MTEIRSTTVNGFADLEFLSDSEKKKLESVLNRNEKLKKNENARLRKLSFTETESNLQKFSQEFNKSTRSINSCHEYRSDISDLMQDNANDRIRPFDINIIGNCISCGRRFSFLPWSCASANSNSCSLCKAKMCKKCTHHMDRPRVEICKSCHKNILFEAKSGKWFYNTKDDQNSPDSARPVSVIDNNRWKSMDKFISLKKEFGSADHLQNSGISSQTSTSNKNFFQRKKFNNSAYFRVDSPNRFNLSPETTDNNVSPFRRINKPLKNNCLSSSNYFDTTLKSEDSGCALDMDDDTTSESALKNSPGTVFGPNSKCYFRPLQILQQNNSNNDHMPNESQDCMFFNHIRPDFSYNVPYTGNINQSKHVGEIMLSLIYDDNTSMINITIHKCRNLVSADQYLNCINPYIILFVKPNRSKQCKQKTRTEFSTNNPVFEEYFLINFEIGESDSQPSLILLLCHKNYKTGKDLAIGKLVLTPLDILHCDQINKWYLFLRMNPLKNSSPDHKSVISRTSDLSPPCVSTGSVIPFSDYMSLNDDLKSLDFTVTGEISLAIKFVTCSVTTNKNNELHLWVKSARITDFQSSNENVKNSSSQKSFDNTQTQTSIFNKRKICNGNSWLSDILGYQDIVAKSHLFTIHGVYSKELTATNILDKGHYIWSSIMKFETDLVELKNSTLEISLWIHSNNAILSRILPSRCIGSIYLGVNSDRQKYTSTGDRTCNSKSMNESKLWQAMLNKHNIWIDEILVLKNRKGRF